jgi:putative cell wall-binding protein
MTRPAGRRLLSVLFSLSLIAALAAPVAAVDGATYVNLVNQKRASLGLSPVALHAKVDQVAVERANQMATTDTFAHDMAYVSNRLKALGVCFSGYGEIIAWEKGYPTYDPARTIAQWWASPGHHDIIIGNYNAAGGSHSKSAASGKIYSVMVFVKLCAGSTIPAPTPPPPTDTDNTSIQRIAGSDRYATAAALSRARFPGGASTVFVATGASFPDALSGSPAAAHFNGPVLLTAQGSLPAATATELARLRPSKIVVVGGEAAVGVPVVAALYRYAPAVERWSGSTRFDTAATISRIAFSSGAPVAYVTTGRSFPDALSGGAVAGHAGGPILLVERDGIPTATASELARLRPGSIVVLGGPSAVSDAVRSALARYARSGSVTRLAGADRYATSVQISRSAFGNTTGAAFIATGTSFPDGLAGGAVAALVPGPLLLVSPTQLPGTVSAELQRLTPDAVYVLGGSAAVSNGVVSAVDAALP